MADHARKQIRDQITTTLTGLVTTGANVFPSRIYPREAAVLPGLSIYTSSEVLSDLADTVDTKELRELTVTIEGRTQVVDTFDDVLDGISAEVEVALYADTTLNGLVKDLELRAVEYSYDAEGKVPVGRVEMTWWVLYRVDATNPTVIIS